MLEYKDEREDEEVKQHPEEWLKVKCDYEARVVSLLMYWMGGTNQEFSDSTLGIVIKIRRARITIQLWFDGENKCNRLREQLIAFLKSDDQ